MATRMVIPIPEQPQQTDLVFQFVDRESDGLVEFHGEGIAAHIAAFRKVNDGIDDHYWSQAAVAASLSKKYGKGKYDDKGLEALAEAVELSLNYLRQIARTYRTFSQFIPRDKDLKFNHHKIACNYKKPEDALAHAKANGMSCRALEQWVTEQNRKRAKSITRKRKELATRTPFLEHLEHVETIIETDFIANCPSGDFARRVYQEWLTEIKFELRQLNRKANEDVIRAAIEEDGAATLVEIRSATTLSISEIEAVVGAWVAKNEYEWIPKSGTGKLEDSRGQQTMMLHKVGTSDGSGYNAHRPVNHYSN